MRLQAKLVRLLAVLLIVVAAFAYGVGQLTLPVAPRAGPASDRSESERTADSQPATTVGNLELPREEQVAVADAQSGKLGAREFEVQVLDHEAPGDADVRVELLFGGRDNLKSVVLILDRAGAAKWPSGSHAPRPWLVDFAFPTVGASSRSLTDHTLRAQLTMPPTCVLDIEVMELDGRVTSDELTVAARAPQAMWPMNRWRPVHMVGGRAKLLAEASGQRVDLQITGASGRSTQAVCFAADAAGERVPVSVPFPPIDGVELELHDLPKSDSGPQTEPEWLVAAYTLDRGQMSCHRLPQQGQRYVFFPRKQSPVMQSGRSWFVTAKRATGSGSVYWGEGNDAEALTMRPFALLAVGRCVDVKGVGVQGCQVDLTAVGRRGVLHAVTTDQNGKFQIMGPAQASFGLEAVLHGSTGEQRVSAPLPHQGLLTLRVAR